MQSLQEKDMCRKKAADILFPSLDFPDAGNSRSDVNCEQLVTSSKWRREDM